jgi:CBS domain containing-hemolysin-like protein
LTALLVIAALIFVNAVYVAAEFAAVSVRRSRIRQLAASGNRLATWLLPVLTSPNTLDRYIAACQIGITVSGLVLGAFAQSEISAPLIDRLVAAGFERELSETAASIVVLLLLTIAQVVFAELVPRSVALQHPSRIATLSAVPMMPSLWLFAPFIRLLNAGGLVLRRLIRAPVPTHRHIHSPEEIELLMAESRDGGLLEADEHQRLHRALRLRARQARQIMVPRTAMSAVDIRTPIDDIVGIVARNPYSRLPVYRDSLDNVVGLLHTKDLARWLVASNHDAGLAQMIRPIASVHESVAADRVLQELRRRGTHQALVVDEFGGTAGLLTLEDLLAELFGDVGDEFKPGEPVPVTLADGRVRLPGQLPVQDAASLLGTTWRTSAATVNGLVTEALGHLPTSGETVTIGDVVFEVEGVRRRTLVSVLARRVGPPQRSDAS